MSRGSGWRGAVTTTGCVDGRADVEEEEDGQVDVVRLLADPVALRRLLHQEYPPADSAAAQALESVLAAYAQWRRVGQMGWGMTGGAVEIGEGNRWRRAAARHLRDQLLELLRCGRGGRGRARWPQTAGVPLAACVAPTAGYGPWEWATEAVELEQQLLAWYRPTDPVAAMVITLVASAYGDLQRFQGRRGDRVGDWFGEWQVQAHHRHAARHLEAMMSAWHRIQAHTSHPVVEVVRVRRMDGEADGVGPGRLPPSPGEGSP